MFNRFLIGLFITMALLSVGSSSTEAAVMGDYCQAPPYITSVASPNIMLDVDVSGSMDFSAYQIHSDKQRYCSGNTQIKCEDDNEHDCVRNWGTCGTDHRCSGHDEQHCDVNTDCTRNWGTCSSTAGSTQYGTCSNNSLTGCDADSVTANCGAGNTCIAKQTYEGYFDPAKSYVPGFCSNDATKDCLKDSQCGTGNICNFISGYCSSSGASCTTAADCTGTGNVCTPFYSEYASAAGTCSVKYTYQCNNSTNPTSTQCPNKTLTKPSDALNTCTKWYCTPKGAPTQITGTCGTSVSGNWLNYLYMTRMDLLRWTMTGGAPAMCNAVDVTRCDPRAYLTETASGKVGTVCKDNLRLTNTGTTGHGCILKATGSAKRCALGGPCSDNSDCTGAGNSCVSYSDPSVAIPWTGRIEDGLAFKFAEMPVKPRMGAYFFSGEAATAIRSGNDDRIYIGDFTANSNPSVQFAYRNLLAAVNGMVPSGYTPTGPSLWDILNYLSQVNPQYGGLDARSASNYKSPMYDCDGSGAGANCKYVPCAKNFVLLMSDGLWNRASCDIGASPITTLPTLPSNNSGYTGSPDPVVSAYLMHKGFNNFQTNVNTNVTSVYTVGMFVSTAGQQALKNIALYGSFTNSGDWPTGATGYPTDACTISDATSGCSGNAGSGSNCTAPPSEPNTYYAADDALDMRTNIMAAVQSMLARASSGTAASVLASGEGSGANIVQSIFYPRHTFADGQPELMWTSTLRNLWYYLDPKSSSSSIRENSSDPSGATSLQLNLNLDKIVNYWFDSDAQRTKAKLYADANGDGIKDSATYTLINAEDLKHLWESGVMLWQKNAVDRAIYTNTNNTSTMTSFVTGNLATTTPTLQSLLNTDTSRGSTNNTTVAQNLVDFIRGTDFASPVTVGTETFTYRNRTTAIDLNNDGTISGTDESAKVWKLGDIVNSTPRISSWIPLNSYDKSYGDSTYAEFYSTTGTGGYKSRGMVFTGANDGMLHAFKLGTLALFDEQYKKAELQGTSLGEERWAFIPKNALPYLQYLADGSTDYCHLYYIDATPIVFDASIGKPSTCTSNYWDCTKSSSTWRTILIGGMRMGGACKASTYTGANGVIEPASGLGYSSYFALDVTDQENPKLLWEFAPTDGSLGFTTSGPAIVRINARDFTASGSTANKAKNGRWFVVFGSGPTGPIDTAAHQFKGHSDQELKLFILDLAGPGSGNNWTADTNYWVKSTGLNNAFSGSLYNGNIDYDIDYQDDSLYIGYTQSEDSTPGTATKWNAGGILRLVTREDLNGATIATTALNPSLWEPSTLKSGIGAVSASIAHLAHYATKSSRPDTAYLYAGTGRYYFNTTAGADDADTQRSIYAITEPCLNNILNNVSCSTSSTGTLGNATSSGSGVSPVTYPAGWYINLDASSTDNAAERVITDPLATPTGAVFFTTTAPGKNVCQFGGSSYLWAVKYDTGGSVSSALSGVGLLQLSTGAIEEIKLNTDGFGTITDETHKYGRRSDSLDGIPPIGQGLSLVVPPKPINTILHMRKK